MTPSFRPKAVLVDGVARADLVRSPVLGVPGRAPSDTGNALDEEWPGPAGVSVRPCAGRDGRRPAKTGK